MTTGQAWIEASNGCGEWGAQWAFADASLKRAQARIAQLEAELDERDQAAMERDR